MSHDETSPLSGPDQPNVIRYVGDYELLEEIGRGGAGVVYRAVQRSLKREVAVKLIRSGELATAKQIERFQREARAAAKLDHSAIVPIFEVGTENGVHFYSMRLVPGVSLAELIAEGQATPREFARILATVALGVEHAHSRGILHRDLKPGNILIEGDGTALVTDFGLARHLEAADLTNLTPSGAIVGTPRYLAPEQAFGRVLSPATDVYSLGVTLYECLTGRTPFPASGEEVPLPTLLREIQTGTPAAMNLPRMARDLETICMKCLERDPGRRYPSAFGLAEDLQAWLDQRPISARRPSRLYRGRLWLARRSNAARFAAAWVVLMMLAAAFWLSLPRPQPQQIATENPPVQPDPDPGRLAREEQARKAAEEARRLADETRRREYLADLPLASDAWAKADHGKVRELLNKHVPAANQADQRGWEWHLLDRCCAEADQVVFRQEFLRGPRFLLSPNGRWLLVHSDGMQLIDVENGKVLKHVRDYHLGSNDGRCFLADSSGVWVSQADKFLLVSLPEFEVRATVRRTQPRIESLTYSPDGKQLIYHTLGADPDKPRSEIVAVDAATGQERLRIAVTANRTSYSALRTSATGRWLAATESQFAPGGLVESTKVWDLATGNVQLEVPGKTQFLDWGTNENELLVRASGQTGVQTSFQYADAAIWDVEKKAAVQLLRNVRKFNHFVQTVVPAGWRWATGGGRIRMDGPDYSGFLPVTFTWDQSTGNLIDIEPNPPRTGNYAVTNTRTSEGEELTIRRIGPAKTAEVTLWWEGLWHASEFGWSSPNAFHFGYPADATTWFADTNTQKRFDEGWPRVLRIHNPQHYPDSRVSWRPDGKRLIFHGTRGTQMWDVAANVAGPRATSEIRRGGSQLQMAAAWAPDGVRIACFTGRQSLEFLGTYNTETGELERKLAIGSSSGKTASFSPNGKWIAAQAYDEIQVFDATTGARKVTLPDARDPSSVVLLWSPDGRFLASLSGEAMLWDVEKPAPPIRFAECRYAAWSPDSRWLAVSSRTPKVLVVSAATGKVAHELVEPAGEKRRPGEYATPTWSPDGKRLAVLRGERGDGELVVWDATSGKHLFTWQRPADAYLWTNFLSWSPQSDRVALTMMKPGANSRNPFQVHDGTTGEVLEPPAEKDRWWDPNDPRLVRFQELPGSRDVELVRPTERFQLGREDPRLRFEGAHMVTSPDRKRVVRVVESVSSGHPESDGSKPVQPRILSAETGEVLLNLERPPGWIMTSTSGWDRGPGSQPIAWQPDGRGIAAATQEGHVLLWNTATGKIVWTQKREPPAKPNAARDSTAYALVWSRDGKHLAVGLWSTHPDTESNTITVHDGASGKEVHRFAGPPSGLRCMAFNPRGDRIVAGCFDGTARVYDLTGRELLVLRSNNGEVSGVAWHPDGTRIATADQLNPNESGKARVHVWDAESGAELLKVSGHTHVAWSPDGRRLACRNLPTSWVSDLDRDLHGNRKPEILILDAGSGARGPK